MPTRRADRQRLTVYLRHNCRGRVNRMKQADLAAALGWSTRYLQDVLSEEAGGVVARRVRAVAVGSMKRR